MSNKHLLFKGILWSTFQQGGTQLISLLLTVVLSRILLPSQFGLIAIISIFISLGSSLIDSGLSQSLIRTKNIEEDDYSTVFILNVLISVLVYVFIYIFSNYIAQFFHQPILSNILKLYCLTFVINSFTIVQTTKLTKALNFKKQSYIYLLSILISSLITIFLAKNGWGVWSLVWKAIIESILICVFHWTSSSWMPRLALNSEKVKTHLRFGYKLTISGIIETLFINSYAIIIAKYFSPIQVAFYNRADTIKQMPVSNFIYIINKVFFPVLSKFQDDDIKLKYFFSKIIKMVVFIVAPTLLFMTILATPLFRFLFTEKWLPAVPFFQILCINGLLYPIHAFNLNILYIKGQSGTFLKLEIIKKTILTLILIISFRWGIYGIIYGGIISSMFALIINTYYTNKFLGYSLLNQIIDVTPTIIICILSGLVVYLTNIQLINQLDIIRIILPSIIGVSLYTILAYIFKIESFFEIKNLIYKPNYLS